jgi:hypothetical protein
MATSACAAPPPSARPHHADPAREATTTARDPIVSGYGYRVELVDETSDVRHADELRTWLLRAMQSVSDTTGGSSLLVRVRAREGSGGASTRGQVISIQLPPGPRPAEPSREWVLHHELIHASFPSLPDDDLWLEEGLATYLEPLLRVRAGQLDAKEMWHDFGSDLPQGSPRAGEKGLAGTTVWHRLYWQGAVFWLDAELTIDRRTHGQRSLRDALCSYARALDAPGDWTAERAFAVMDAALGEPILLELYRKASARGIDRDPRVLLSELGVELLPGRDVRFAPDAPAAGLRARMTEQSLQACGR